MKHARKECWSVSGCYECRNSPPPGAKSRSYDLSDADIDGEVAAYRVVDNQRGLVTYQLTVDGQLIVLTPTMIPAVEAFLEAIDIENRLYRACPNPWCWCWIKPSRERHEADSHTPPLFDFEKAWSHYFANHPEVVATWGHQNGRLPTCTCKKCLGSGAGVSGD